MKAGISGSVKTNKMLDLKFSPFPKIVTPRLVLREVTPSDVKEILFMRSDDSVMQYIKKAKAKDEQEAMAFINMIADQQRNGQSITWAITEKGNDTMRGTICIWNIQKDHYRGELGYGMYPELWGKGIMHECLQAVVQYGFEKMKLHTLVAHIDPDNNASAKLLERNGFVKEGHHREDYHYDGVFYDTAVYGLVSPIPFRPE
jgi:ribosomal-protein-alanine N-acetyltransferase